MAGFNQSSWRMFVNTSYMLTKLRLSLKELGGKLTEEDRENYIYLAFANKKNYEFQKKTLILKIESSKSKIDIAVDLKPNELPQSFHFYSNPKMIMMSIAAQKRR